MKVHLLLHFDGGNRGCEGIAKGTAELLHFPSKAMIAYSRDCKGDAILGINKCYTLRNVSLSFFQKVRRKIYSIFVKNREKQKSFFYNLCYLPFLKQMNKEDVFLSTGGDMLCYDDNEVIFTNEYLHKKRIKTILWGCSMGPKNLTQAKLDTLKKFSKIYARESLTYNFFQSLGLKNVFLYPDPAFSLNPEPCELPSCFLDKNVIGVNVSKFVAGGNTIETHSAKQLLCFFDHVLKKTNLHVLLVPHVLWDDQNDYVLSSLIERKYASTGRISILDSKKLNYCQIRYVISKCRFFIGARTHAVISAYSECVPTIALGYSIKSHGIAKDLNLPPNLVIDLLSENNSSSLLGAFDYLQLNESEIKRILQDNIPRYKRKLDLVKVTFFN